MKVKECMTKTIYGCRPETTLQEVAKTMNTNHIGCVPICDNSNNLVGLITDRDIVLRGVAFGKDITSTPASEIMKKNLYCCNEDEEVTEVEKIMSKWQVKRVPVIQNNKVIGIVTMGNLVNNAKTDSQEVYRAVENICHCGSNAKNAE